MKVIQRIPVKILFDEPVNGETGLPLGPGESVVPTVEVSSPEYSPVPVGIALVVLLVGLFFILRQGLRRKPQARGCPDRGLIFAGELWQLHRWREHLLRVRNRSSIPGSSLSR